MAAKKIPPGLEPEIVGKHLAGMNHRDISAWVLAEHKLEISYRTIGRFLEGTRKDNAEGIKSAVRTKLGGQVMGDLDLLQVHVDHLHDLAEELFEKRKIPAYRQTVEQLRKLCHSRLHFSGADSPDDTLAELSEYAKRVTSRMAGLTAKHRARAVPEGTGTDDSGAGSP